jgi:hypothetical protein
MKACRICSMLAVVVAVVMSLGTASAQKSPPASWTEKGATAAIETNLGIPDLLKVNYFSNANTSGAPDGTVRITNPGSYAGNLCAEIYVYDPDQELSECCACEVTPDGLRTLSVNIDLTANPLTSTVLTNGQVSIVSGIVPSGGCNPLNPWVYPTIRAWGTHIQNNNFAITETEYSDRALGPYNYNLLIDCWAARLDGSGAGVCTCGTGD